MGSSTLSEMLTGMRDRIVSVIQARREGSSLPFDAIGTSRYPYSVYAVCHDEYSASDWKAAENAQRCSTCGRCLCP